ncbi:TetR/AcrR family transcriptional regulator, partial [Streptomyces sp. SBT349]|uniref:TetR/AcrR family transcriptional regulator n=1 Tax=Streptomyces sp. SBT349 TaxID=1580539 RepID=UPI00066D11C3
MRADAKRNYDLLITAAKDVFAERGHQAPLDDIARRAGVGNATMYRHFPTRRDLLVAVYADEVAELRTLATTLQAELPPAEALFTWLRAFVTHVATKRDLALATPEDGTTPFAAWHTTMRTTATTLLTHAQRAGTIRPDLTADDLLPLATAIALTTTT